MTKIDNAITEAGTLTGAIENATDSLVNSAVGAISPFNELGKYLTGSRAVIKVNDKLFGFAFGVTFNIQTQTTEINTIDDWTPYELAPSRILVNGTMNLFHIPGKSPTKELVQANMLSFLFHKYITISISDQTTGQKIFETKKAVITSRRQTIQAGELSTITLEWKAIGFIDDITPFYPDNYDGKTTNPGGSGLLDTIGKLF